jgi:hypothetical protein
MSAIIAPDTEGLSTHANDLNAPIGSTSVADNVAFTREGRPERRPGFKDYSTNLPDFSPAQLLSSAKQDQAYLHVDNGIWYASGGTWLRKRGKFGCGMTDPYDAVYVSGHLYVLSNNVVWDFDLSTGARTILAGRFNVAGTTDGTGGSARFSVAIGITSDGTSLFVAESTQHTIRKVVISSGVVTTLAGTAGSSGTTDATGASARFNSPRGITNDGTNLYVCDYANHTIRKVVISSGVVTTLAGTGGSSGTTDATGASARFNNPSGITYYNLNLYVCDTGNQTIRKIVASSGVVTTYAGSAGVADSTDGFINVARFSSPTRITNIGSNLYLTDQGNGTIRKIATASATTATTAGTPGVVGTSDGIGASASWQLNRLNGIANDGVDLYVCEVTSGGVGYSIRKLYSATGYVTALCGFEENSTGTTPGSLSVSAIILGPS